MKEAYYSNKTLAAHAKHRPAGYLRELERCITRRSATGFWVDESSDAWKRLREKYAPAREAETPGCGPAAPRADWPWYARAAEKLSRPDEKGAGDTLARLFGGKLTKAAIKDLGIDCGCGDRAARLNAKYPYGGVL